ncbi:MAG TPA: hypothetical protein VGN34_27995 [Ktedonobacteraceae bacterium]
MLFPTSWGLDQTSSVNLPFAANLVIYLLFWVVIIAGLYFIYKRGKSAGFGRWTTQDILVIAIMAVLLEVYDNLIGDQFITPIIQLIPFGHAFALNDLPYMFLFVTGIVLVRKPGAATAMVFLNFILMQLLYSGSGINPLLWSYGLLQGLLVDVYIALRGKQIFANGGWRAVLDGLIIGALRAFPAVTFQSAILGPLLEGQVRTVGYIILYTIFNVIGNGVEAAISAPLGIRIARSVNQTVGQEVVTSDEELAAPAE